MNTENEYNLNMQHLATTQVFEDLIKECGWKPSDGFIPGYFRDNPPGSRWVGSCIWVCPLKTFSPDDILGLDSMSNAQLMAEMHDVFFRQGLIPPECISAGVVKKLRELRVTNGVYPEYVWPFGDWSKQNRGLVRLPIREGWGSREMALERGCQAGIRLV